MKPRSLAMQAFGPFANRETVDFTRLPEDSLFLIHGPTGAGKSTLFDGICFALYGDTSGGERQPREMRSHHAADTVQTEVELEFELGARRFRVKRIPEQERAALRGKDGLVKVPAKAELHEWDDTSGRCWRPAAAKLLRKSKLCSVSRRRSFARSSCCRKTSFASCWPQTPGSAKNPRSLVQHAAMQTTAGTASIRRPRHGSPGDRGQAASRDAVPASGNHHRRGTDTKMVQLGETLVTLTADEANLRLAANTAAAAVSAGEALAARFQEQQLATTALGKLQETEAAMGARRKSLATARRAQQVLPARSAFHDATEQHQQQLAHVEQATTAATNASALLTTAAAAFAAEDSRAPERSQAATELNRLEGLRAATARLVEAESVRVAAVKARDKARNLFDALDRDARTQAEKRKALAASLEKIAPLAAKAEMLKRDIAVQEDRLDSLKKLVEAAKLGEQAKEALASADQVMTQASEALDLARKHRDALDLAWRTGQAAVLARHLVDGGPCPVCGSEEHPHPAEDTDAIPADAEIEAAKTAFTSAEAALERSRTARTLAATNATTQTATFDTLRSALGLADGAPLPAIKPATEAIAALRDQEKQATAAQKDMDAQRLQLAAIDPVIVEVAHKLDAARESLGRASEEASKAEGLAHAHAQAVPESLRGSDALESALATVRTRIESLERALVTVRAAHQKAQADVAASEATRTAQSAALAECVARLAAARTSFASALTDAGFADEAVFDAALLEPADIAEREQQIKAHDLAIAAARERLVRAAAAVAGLPAPEQEALRNALAAAQQALEALLARQNTARAQLEGARRTAGMLDEIRRELGDLEERYRVMGDLAAVANGRNGANLTFQRYVLAALLDDVLLQASLRLRAMSRNRYTLQRSQAVADGRRAAGLDLEVLDDYTGRVRPASTLSGGEGFLASLSLALGLSDVVQGYAGGIQLDTLFIDEGFGSLDPESLDLAMKTLIDLRQQGRRVGIISHVDELKREIACGIEVRASPGGSSVHIV
ncbi:MAG: AAA family ATPase [Sulfuritalea sp.]|nr:AAA family ATPase [Sulfuritalea sp.]